MKMKDKADVVIVGGGVSGCALAYYLAKAGVDVVVVEREFIAAGATGCCAGGIRQQFGAERTKWIKLTRETVKIFETLDEELNCDTEFTQKGYLLPIVNEEEVHGYKENLRIQRSLGVHAELLDSDEVKEHEPLLDVEGVGIIGATFCQQDGTANPFKVTYCYAGEAKKLGASIYTYTEVQDIETLSDGEITKVKTSRGDIRTNIVVNAAGGHSRDVAKMVGVQLPNLALSEEQMASEALKPTLKTLTFARYTSPSSPGIFIHQTRSGEIIGPGRMRLGHSKSTSLSFLREQTRKLVKYFPDLRHVNVLRTWAGIHDYTPDGYPILGPTDGIETFIQFNGLSGLGFMIAPICGKLLSEVIVKGKPSILSTLVESLNLRRFKGKPALTEEQWSARQYEGEYKPPTQI